MLKNTEEMCNEIVRRVAEMDENQQREVMALVDSLLAVRIAGEPVNHGGNVVDVLRRENG